MYVWPAGLLFLHFTSQSVCIPPFLLGACRASANVVEVSLLITIGSHDENGCTIDIDGGVIHSDLNLKLSFNPFFNLLLVFGTQAIQAQVGIPSLSHCPFNPLLRKLYFTLLHGFLIEHNTHVSHPPTVSPSSNTTKWVRPTFALPPPFVFTPVFPPHSLSQSPHSCGVLSRNDERYPRSTGVIVLKPSIPFSKVWRGKAAGSASQRCHMPPIFLALSSNSRSITCAWSTSVYMNADSRTAAGVPTKTNKATMSAVFAMSLPCLKVDHEDGTVATAHQHAEEPALLCMILDVRMPLVKVEASEPLMSQCLLSAVTGLGLQRSESVPVYAFSRRLCRNFPSRCSRRS